MNKGKKFLSDLKLHSDYLKWRKDKNRYETWEEACEDIVSGHRQRYATLDIEVYLKIALDALKNKVVLASQRNLQYRYEQISNNNSRLYNCVGVLFNRNDYFQKCFYILLSGCGLDFSIRKRFVDHLSLIAPRDKGTKTFIIPDSIEGWSDALGVLISSYLVSDQPFPEYAGYQVRFDYSLIRPKGAYISGGFKAPGPDGLKQSLDRIEQLINHWLLSRGQKIAPILVYDIIMHAADAVLSGGVRRCLAKGSKVLVKDGTYKLIENISKDDYVKTLKGYRKVINTFIQGEQKTIKIVHQSGELTCTPNHKVAVIEGKEVIWKKAEELKIKDKLIFLLKEEETIYVNKLPEFSYIRPLHSTTCKNIVIPELDEEVAYLIGLIQGDGYVRLTSKSGELSVAIERGRPEKAYFVADILRRFNVSPGIQEPNERENCFKIRVKSKQLATYLHEHVKQAKATLKIPKFILQASPEIKKAFISGIFCADGSFKTRPTQVATSVYRPFLEELQVLLSELGVHSNIKYRVYPSRKETWQDIYSLNIRGKENFNKFKELLVLTPKANDKDYIINQGNTTILKPIGYIQPILIEEILEGNTVETFDIEVEDEHSFMCEGVLVHNSACSVLIDEDDQEMIEAKLGNWRQTNPQRARSNNAIGFIRNSFSYEKLHGIINLNQGDNDISFIFVHDEWEASNPCREITFRPILEDGRTGFQMCNLCEINASACDTPPKFLEACRAAAILGTLQAGYTKFPYLGKDTEELVKREALIGVSITGWMNNPMLLDPDLLRTGADMVKFVNGQLAKVIGINAAARTTTVKPSGNASVILGTASGIHPEHSEKYFRIMQLNKESNTAKYLEEHMPFLLEESVWSASNSDYVVYVPIENPKNGLYKKDMKGVKHLEFVKLVQENWVNAGTNVDLCLKPWLRNSVSCTVIIDDIDKIARYIFDNQNSFKAASFISDFGDKDFNQAPFTSVSSLEDVISKYGKGALFASGLIVDGLHYFNDNLWVACDLVKDRAIRVTGTREQVILKKYWLSRVKKFAHNFFDNDIEKTVHCLKDVHLLHKWEVINRGFQLVDFSKILAKPEYKEISEFSAVACSGGACEITKF